MRFRTSLSSLQVTLLTAMGFGALSACSGRVVSLAERTGDDAGSNGGAEHSTGGIAGASSGGARADGGSSAGGSDGGRASGGAPNGGSGGVSSGGASSGGAAGAGGSAGAGVLCESPVPVTTTGTGTGPTGGYVRCADGTVHRPKVDECWSSIDPNAGPTFPPATTVTYACHKNADCTEHPHGHCDVPRSYGPALPPSTSCVYGCVRDSECAAGQICMCGDPVGTCVDARCASDEDCASATPCMMGTELAICGPSIIHFTCGPLCVKDADCAQGGPFSETCVAGSCRPSGVCGRPFLVGLEPRLAGVALRSDWATPRCPDVASLPQDVRRALAEHYAAIGLMEHASVAAFARFSLELLGLGAPAEIVALAADALRDETEHAKLCFGLAAAYGGSAVGPGRLDVSGALEQTPLAEKVRTAFVEACVGETCAAVEAAEAAARATDPVVVAVLGRISADETRHAELGWRFAKWALDAMDGSTRAAVLGDLHAVVARELEASEAAVVARAESALLVAHGVLPSSLRAALRRATIRDVVVPCLRMLSHGDVDAARVHIPSVVDARVARATQIGSGI